MNLEGNPEDMRTVMNIQTCWADILQLGDKDLLNDSLKAVLSKLSWELPFITYGHKGMILGIQIISGQKNK